MPYSIGRDRLDALARGFSLLGSGGGGVTTLLELMAADLPIWPVTVHEHHELPVETPCAAIAFAGSTHLLAERLPAAGAFDRLIDGATRWTGQRPLAVCGLEAAGLNGITPLLLAEDQMLVDADFMGRALPRLDQLSILVDRVPGVVMLCSTGDRGTVLAESARAEDIESQMRSAIVQAGGTGAVLVAGFTVGDLAEHAVLGTYRRALELGAVAPDQPFERLAEELGARVLGAGKVTTVAPSPNDPYSSSAELVDRDGALVRLVARSEFLAVLRDGVTTAASPEIIVALDSLTRVALQVDAVTVARHVTVLALPAPAWWLTSELRRRHVTPSAFGLADLEVAA